MESIELTPALKWFQSLRRLIETLRGPAGCPWDRKQTPKSIIGYLTEEVYELTDAIADDHPGEVSEELGDVIFLALFLVDLYREDNCFGLDRVLMDVHAKMVRRHPHVFDDLEVKNSAEVSRNWARIKQAEKPDAQYGSVVEDIPHAVPALSRAYRICKAVAEAGVDSPSSDAIWNRFNSAVDAFGQIFQKTPVAEAHRTAFGNLLWQLVLLGQATGLDPDTALSEVVDRFEERFRKLEASVGDEAFRTGAGSVVSSQKIDLLFE